MPMCVTEQWQCIDNDSECTHCTPESCANTNHELHLKTPISVILAAYFPMPHPQKTQVLDQEIHYILILETVCSILHGHSSIIVLLPSELRILTTHSELPLRANTVQFLFH